MNVQLSNVHFDVRALRKNRVGVDVSFSNFFFIYLWLCQIKSKTWRARNSLRIFCSNSSFLKLSCNLPSLGSVGWFIEGLDSFVCPFCRFCPFCSKFFRCFVGSINSYRTYLNLTGRGRCVKWCKSFFSAIFWLIFHSRSQPPRLIYQKKKSRSVPKWGDDS